MLALLHFERSPGRYPIALREPRPLFEHIASVVLLATGRPVEGLPAAPSVEPELRRAARYFVRTVMLRPGADPYTLLGLKPGFAPGQLREHYRHMIRLTHPDHESAGEGWPSDAAARINLARQVLLSGEPLPKPGVALQRAPGRRPAAPRTALPRPPRTALVSATVPARPHPWSMRARRALAAMSADVLEGLVVVFGPRRLEQDAARRKELKP